MRISLIRKYFSQLEPGIYPGSPVSAKLGAYIHQEVLSQFKDIPKEINMMVNISNYIKQFNKYLDEKGITILDVEIFTEINSMNLYLNGSADILACDSKGNMGVIELKCGNVIDGHKYQVVLYAKGLREAYHLPIKFVSLLYLSEYEYYEVTKNESELNDLIKETERLVNKHSNSLLIFEKENGYNGFED